jgi:peptidoglycan/LPS O-acetylase OafA/YrhL
MVSLIVVKIVLVIAILVYWPQSQWKPVTKAEIANWDHICKTLTHFRIEMMACGGLCATWFVRRAGKMPAIVTHPISQLVSISLLIATLAVDNVFIEPVLCFGFSHLTLANLGTKRKTGALGFVLSYLGRISYGIYMYHMMVILFVMQILESINHDIFGYQVLVYVLTIFVTITVSAISYHYLERPFLSLKEKYSRLANLTH